MKKEVTYTKEIRVCDYCGEELPNWGATAIDGKEYHNNCYFEYVA